jgi:nicotinate-nucleotide--dimethylbenzimidazole phosphoribosyltransferase
MPAPPDWPAAPAAAGGASPHDDFWDRISEELATDARRAEGTPSAAADPRATGGDRQSPPADELPDEVAEAGSGTAGSGPGRPAERDRWNAWEPSVSSRPGFPPTGGEDGPHEREDEPRDRAAAGRQDAAPVPARPDAADHHPGAPGAGEEASAAEEEVEEEEEEAAPSPWSIPLALVGDLDLDEEDDRQPTGPESVAEDAGTETAPAAGTGPTAEQTGSDLWTRASRTGTDAEKTRAAPTEADGDSGDEETDEAGQARVGAGAAQAREDATPGRADGDAAAGADAGDRDAGAARTGGDAAAGPDDRDADGDAAATGEDGGAAARTEGNADAGPGDGGAAGADSDAARETATAMADSAPGAASKTEAAGQPAPGGAAEPPSAKPAGPRPASLFEPAAGKAPGAPGTSPGPIAGKTAGPAASGGAPPPTEQADRAWQPETGREPAEGQTKPATGRTESAGGSTKPAAGRTEPAADTPSDHEESGPSKRPDDNLVVIVPGVARYHRSGCILIRFLGGDDLERSSRQEAEANGCVPCRACEPEKPLSAEA